MTVIAPRSWGRQKAEITKAAEYDLKLLPCALSGWPHFHFYPSVVRLLRDMDCDLVHIEEEPFSLVTYELMSFAVHRKRPALFVTWQNLFKHYPLPFSLMEQYSFAHAAGAFAGTGEALAILRRRGYEGSAWVVPQCVDPEVFRPQESLDVRRELGLEGMFAVGFMGRLVKEKGIDTLLDALAMLPRDCVAVIVGSGPYRGSLVQQSERLSLERRVRWIPSVTSMEVPKYMSALDVLVLPSKTRRHWKEQFGRVLVEAMACGVPVVGSDSGEIPRVIGHAGLVFAEGDARALAERLRSLIADSQFRSDIGTQGRARVLEHFTYARIAKQTVAIYRAILSGTPPA